MSVNMEPFYEAVCWRKKPLIVLGIGGIVTKLTTIRSLEMKHVAKNTYLNSLTVKTARVS